MVVFSSEAAGQSERAFGQDEYNHEQVLNSALVTVVAFFYKKVVLVCC